MATLQEIISKAKANNDFIYRGCACESYELVPTLARDLPKTSFKDYSACAAIVEEAAKRGYTDVSMGGGINELSQHYGLSTSYLDWSYSVYVALYFSFTSYIKQFVDKKIIGQKNIEPLSLRKEFNDHNYCLYSLNKTTYDEMKQRYPDLPLLIIDTDRNNKRMLAQKGLLSSIDRNNKVISGIKIQNSQIEILDEYLKQTYSVDLLKIKGDKKGSIKYCWKNKLFLEKMPFKLSQADRNKLQRDLKSNNAISTQLFPDFEGVKKT